jgi:molybdopterin-guanine dinucleotide biosynthesis protein A
MSKLAAVLLAGGASVRMGRPKAFLLQEGLPLWRFQMNTLLGLEPSELFLSAAPGLEFGPGPWTLLYDRQPGLGPVAGLDAALRASSAERIVVLAVDMPAITTEFLRRLLAEAGEGGIVPRLEGFYYGMVAVYPRDIQPLVEEVLAGEDRSFQHLIRLGIAADLLKVYSVTESEKGFFQHLNSPSDLT